MPPLFACRFSCPFVNSITTVVAIKDGRYTIDDQLAEAIFIEYPKIDQEDEK